MNPVVIGDSVLGFIVGFAGAVAYCYALKFANMIVEIDVSSRLRRSPRARHLLFGMTAVVVISGGIWLIYNEIDAILRHCFAVRDAYLYGCLAGFLFYWLRQWMNCKKRKGKKTGNEILPAIPPTMIQKRTLEALG